MSELPITVACKEAVHPASEGENQTTHSLVGREVVGRVYLRVEKTSCFPLYEIFLLQYNRFVPDIFLSVMSFLAVKRLENLKKREMKSLGENDAEGESMVCISFSEQFRFLL